MRHRLFQVARLGRWSAAWTPTCGVAGAPADGGGLPLPRRRRPLRARARGRTGGELGVLVVAGVRDDGRREILAVEEADTESEATYHDLFPRLKARGLRGRRTGDQRRPPRADGGDRRHFQGASWQRCQVHFARNLLGMVGAKHRARLSEDLRGIFAATTAAQARAAARACAQSLAGQPSPGGGQA